MDDLADRLGLAQRVDGRLAGRAFAAHVGGRGRAHLAGCLATAPFALAATAAAWAWPALGQPRSTSTTLQLPAFRCCK